MALRPSQAGSRRAARAAPPPPERPQPRGPDRRAGVSPARRGPHLRLVGRTASPTVDPPQPQPGEPILQASDPRWVLAIRTAEQLEGTMLRPERRERLLRLGRLLGLGPFDSNLVIAIVQDQARRGYTPAECPTAGEPQLAMVPLPRTTGMLSALRGRAGLRIGFFVTLLVTLELLLIRWLF